MCGKCREWHQHALAVLAGEGPHGCQACNKSDDTLRGESPGDDYRMYVVPADGAYQLLCKACKDLFVVKQRRLYRGTRFGQEVLKIA